MIPRRRLIRNGAAAALLGFLGGCVYAPGLDLDDDDGSRRRARPRPRRWRRRRRWW